MWSCFSVYSPLCDLPKKVRLALFHIFISALILSLPNCLINGPLVNQYNVNQSHFLLKPPTNPSLQSPSLKRHVKLIPLNIIV